MNYIINPSVFYWISVVDGVRNVIIVGLLFGAAAILCCALCYAINDGCLGRDEIKTVKIVLCISIPLVMTGLLGIVFLPDKQTLIEMLIAKNVTVENAEWSLDALKQAVDYIAQAMK